MMDNDLYLGDEFWTRDANGKGYCSTTSIEDAVINHIREMYYCGPDAAGPIVDIQIIRREIKEQRVLLSQNKKAVSVIDSLLENE